MGKITDKIDPEIKETIKDKLRIITNYTSRKNLKNKDFTIISNNCWGGQVYQDLGLEYKTPFIGLFLYAEDYMKLLKSISYYMNQPLTFVNESKYDEANKMIADSYYPVGMLDDIELHFVHYDSEEEAAGKWVRRKDRMNYENLFIKISERDGCTEQTLKEFEALNFKNKLSFSAKEYQGLKHNVFFKENENLGIVENELKIYKKYIKVVKWLNEGKIEKTGVVN